MSRCACHAAHHRNHRGTDRRIASANHALASPLSFADVTVLAGLMLAALAAFTMIAIVLDVAM